MNTEKVKVISTITGNRIVKFPNIPYTNPKEDHDQSWVPDWLSDSQIEPEKRKVVLFLHKGDTIVGAITKLHNHLGRVPTDKEIIIHLG